MTIDLDGLARGLAAVRSAGEPLGAQLDQAATISNEVFDALRPYSGQFGRSPELMLQPMPADLRASLASRLDDVIGLQHDAAQGIDDAFGAGTWMADATRQSRAFASEARRVIADPDLGPSSADQGIALLRENGYAYDQARFALRDGDLAGLLDPRGALARTIDVADEEAFANAARWRETYAGAA